MRSSLRSLAALACMTATCLTTNSCTGGDADGADGSAGENSAGGDRGEDLSPDTPRYAVMYEVYVDDNSTSYLALLDSLDSTEEIDVKKAREIGAGRAFIQAFKNWIFVGDSTSPTATRYSISTRGELVQDKDCSDENPSCQISFARFGFTSGQFDSWNVSFINEEKAYLMNFNDGTTVVWNPTTMEIVGEIAPRDEFLRKGWSLEGSPAALRGNRLFRTFNWANYTEGLYSQDMLLTVYDVEKDEIVDVIAETRCPVFGNLVSTDEIGTIYFNNWVWPVGGYFLNDAPPTCVLRINPGEERFDPEYQFDYTSVTDGRQGAMFTYLADGKALVSAFYDERAQAKKGMTTYEYVGTQNWRIWTVDIENGTGEPLPGIGFNGGAFTPVYGDEGLILLVPGGDEVGYATELYVVDKKGQAQPSLKLPGWSYQMVKLY